MLRRTPLARKNLSHNLARTIVSIGGVALAVVLMFMQLGFLGAVGDTAVVVYQRMPMDLVVRSPDYLHLFEPHSIDNNLVLPLRGMPDIARVRPLDTTLVAWRNPQTQETRTMAMLGIDPHHPAVETAELLQKMGRISGKESVLVDRESGPEFVPEVVAPGIAANVWQPRLGIASEAAAAPPTLAGSGDQFGPQHVGTSAECNGYDVTITGTFQMGTGLAAAAAGVMNREAFRRISFGTHDGRVSMLLIQVREGVDPWQAKSQIQDQLDRLGYRGLSVLHREEVVDYEINRWYFDTPIGLIFFMGVGIAIVVGGVICYMVLAGEVMANLAEYATLKAIGYSNRFLGGVLLQQAVLVAGLAFGPAVLVSLVLYMVTSYLADIPIEMTWLRILAVAIISVLMCTSAGLVALRKLAKAEPASLF